MKKKNNVTIKKIIPSLLVAIVLASLILSPLAIATTTKVKLDNVKSQIETAAKVHLIAQKFQNCIGYNGNGNGSISSNVSSSNAKSGKIYAGTTNIATGPWLEKLVQGKVQNGEIWCKNDDGTIITKLFADAIGVSVDNIICNKNDPYYGGLLAPAKINSTYSGAINYVLGENKNCSNASMYVYNANAETTSNGKKISSGKTYIKELYTEYKNKANNPYLLDFDSLGTFDQVDGYYLYLNDFLTACSSKVFKEEYEGQLTHDDLYFSIATVNDKGEIGTAFYDRNGKNNNSSSETSFVSRGPTTCGALVDKINSYATIYQTKIKEEITKQCENGLSSIVDEKISEVQAIIDDEEASEDAKSLAQTKLDEYNEIKSSGKYTTDTENDGLVCADIPDVTIEVDDPEPDPLDPVTEIEKDPCYSGDVDSMSWLLCPAANNMAKATDGLIGGMIEDILSVDSDLYQMKSKDGGDSGTYQAWGYFRDLANIAMIIVLIVIIFSQITGVGIDNYGIKKMLPKLIAMAILINLSYYICVICIDASNILGESLNKLFQSIGKTIGVENYVQITISGLVTGILAAVAGAGAGATLLVEGLSLVGVTGSSVIVLLVPIIIALLIALVSVLMLFIMLGARLVIIILFTALSPLAFACNILPNTQKIFKKWLDIMKTALVMYPICGALYGLSFVIKAIVFSTDNIHILMGIVAIFSPFIPFLIIPTLVKGALNTLGVVGQKLSGIGDSIKGSMRNAQSAVRNSEQYRDRARIAQDQHAGWRARRQAGLNQDGSLRVGRNGRVKGLYGKLARANGSASTSLDDIKALDRSGLSDTDRRRLSEAEQGMIKYNVGAGNVSAKNPYILSAKEAQADAEARNYKTEVERIKATFGNISSNRDLLNEIDKKWSNGSEAYRVSSLSTLANRHMGKEQIQFLDKYGTKDLSDKELSATMESGEGLAYTWAKEQSKLPKDDRIGFRKFMTSTGPNSFRAAVGKNREKTVGMMTDDSFDYLGGRMKGIDGADIAASPNAVSNDLMISKLTSTTSGKEQTAIMANLLQDNAGQTIQLSYDSLTRIKGSAFAGLDGKFDSSPDGTFNQLMGKIDAGALQTLKADYNAAKQKGAVRLDANTRAALEQFLNSSTPPTP